MISSFTIFQKLQQLGCKWGGGGISAEIVASSLYGFYRWENKRFRVFLFWPFCSTGVSYDKLSVFGSLRNNATNSSSFFLVVIYLQIRICDFLLSVLFFFVSNSLRLVCVFSLFDHFFCVSALRERNKAVKIVVFDSTQGRKVH